MRISPTTIMILSLVVFSHYNGTELVIELFRHGARFPKEKMHESGPLSRESAMDLSITGMRNQFFLGSLTRKKFSYFFVNSVKPNNTHILVSSTNRTVSSAIANFLGISQTCFESETPMIRSLWTPPNVNNFRVFIDSCSLPKKIGFHPLDIQGKNSNFIFHTRKACPLIEARYNKSVTQTIKDLKGKFHASYSVFEKLGYDPRNLFQDKQWNTKNLFEFLDSFRCHMFNSPSLEWTYESRLHMEVLLAIKTFARTRNAELRRVRLFSLYRDWQQKIENFLDSKGNSPKLVLYSGHDGNLSLVLYDLFGKSDLACMTKQYQIHLQGKRISSREDYIRKIHSILSSGCFWFIPFASSISIEVFQIQKVRSI